MSLSKIFLTCVFYVLWTNVYCQSFNPLPRSQRRRPSTNAVLPRSFSPRSVVAAFQNADRIIAERRRNIISRSRPSNQRTDAPSYRHNMFQRSKPRSKVLETTQERFEEATRQLVDEYDLTPEQIKEALAETDLASILNDNTVQDCTRLFNFTNCRRNDRFRTFDGTCNNLNHPSWGMASSCFERLLDPVYADGISQLRRAVSGRELPSPRRVSLEIHNHIDNPTDYVTHMFMQWGQFLDHDISLSPLEQQQDDQPLNCCPDDEDNPPQCGAILIEPDDPFFSSVGVDCLNNARTVICSTCKLGARQQTNQLTAFIDGSHIYGTSQNESNSIRNLNDNSGFLTSVNNNEAGELLPSSFNPNNDGCSFQMENQNCFQAGDARVNQHLAITSFHMIFLRQHNRIARRLRQINPRWDGERIFQETRKIIGAQIQMITYNEFLPLVIGPERMEWFDLTVEPGSTFTQYDPTVQPSLVNEFSTAAYRFGHSMVNSFFPDLTDQSASGNRLRDLFLFPFGLYTRGRLEGVVRGMFQSPAQKYDRNMVRDVTDHLYQLRGNQSGLDLAALNIFRGRDHGIAPYPEVVSFCGGPRISSFRQLDRLFQRGYRQRFQSVYEAVEDIDLFSGGLAERPNQGAVVGPTFTCIIGIQFYHLKYGDRFYFEHGGQAGSFTPGQLREIKKTTFAKIICENSNINEIQRQVMINPSSRNPEVSCNSLPDIDFQQWRE